MIDLFQMILAELNSSVFVLILILVACFVLIYKIGGWTETFKHHEDRVKKVESIKDTVIELKTKVDLIYQNTNPDRPIKTHSPMSLTDIGYEIASDIKADMIFEQHQSALVKMVDVQHSKNAYDIQQRSFTVAKNDMLELLNEDQLIEIKKVAYNKGLLVEDVMSVFGIYLRNKILEDNNIPISDVDKDEKISDNT